MDAKFRSSSCCCSIKERDYVPDRSGPNSRSNVLPRSPWEAQVTAPPLQSARQIYKGKGLRGFYDGYAIGTAKSVLGLGTFITSRDSISEVLSECAESSPPGNKSAWPPFRLRNLSPDTRFTIAGAAAGVTTFSIAFPLDTLKTLIQADTNAFSVTGSTLTPMKAVTGCLRTGGVTRLYRGGLPYLAYYTLSGMTFSKIQSVLNPYFGITPPENN